MRMQVENEWNIEDGMARVPDEAEGESAMAVHEIDFVGAVFDHPAGYSTKGR
jgi:hypothetical protein